MTHSIIHSWRWYCCIAAVLMTTLGLSGTALASDGWGGGSDFRIEKARWNDGRLTVEGKRDRYRDVTVTNAHTGDHVGTDTDNDDDWRVRRYYNDTSQVPCRVRAEQEGGPSEERDVYNAPSDCDDGGGGPPPGGGGDLPNQTDFKMMMNYELGMHCTGFEFAYCCVLPVYNSILAQVVKPEGSGGSDFPYLLEADPNADSIDDALARHQVIRDPSLDGSSNFNKYVMRYWHDAQPRNDGRGKAQSTTLISNVEGNSLLSWGTVADAAQIAGATDPCDRGSLVTGEYNGATGVVLGDGDFDDSGCTFGVPIDNYQNVVWNHLYVYSVDAAGVEGEGGIPGGDRPEADKHRLGLHVDYPTNFGPGGHNMEGLLTYSGEHGTVVYTQMKVLEDLPVTLTSPRIWEALGLPLTPFEDTIDFFGAPGEVDEDSIRPYVQMKAQLYHADCNGSSCTEGSAVLDSHGDPVIGFGTAPIDIPNCERCHSAFDTPNSPNVTGTDEAVLVQQEIDYWKAYYPSLSTGADWYARLKGAAVSILSLHDTEHGTSFLANYPGDGTLRSSSSCVRGNVGQACVLNEDCDTSEDAGDGQCDLPQNTRAGHESVICQKCHADNVIAVVKSAYCGPDSNPLDDPENCADGDLIPPMTEAIHWNHREVSEGGPIDMADGLGRSGGCQGCHPAHRSSGEMDGYPITLDGDNFYAEGDNREANGGCFVGRDVHSNPMKDIDGAETPSHLNAVGEWLQSNVANDTGSWKGMWCTNCHSQASQQIWKAENVADLVNAQPGDAGHVREPSANAELTDVVTAVNTALGTDTSITTFIEWLDPGTHRANDRTHEIWKEDPGLCDYANSYLAPGTYGPVKAAHDGNVAVVELSTGEISDCTTGNARDVNGDGVVDSDDKIDCDAGAFYLCGSYDTDGDFNVSLVGNSEPDAGPLGGVFCTTPDCVASANANLTSTLAVPVPFSAATDGRDHWLSPGEPHCADCHKAPYVEQSGNINAFPPFNYPRKASLMRYSRGHQDITCQGCHESIHGLYPVTPTIDTTSYAQAASLNDDNSHGPLKCGACHDTNSNGVWKDADDLEYKGVRIRDNFDAAVSWMHTFTHEADPREDFCTNCHGDYADEIFSSGSSKGGGGWDEHWLEHADKGRVSRNTMDQVEILEVGHVAGDPAFENPQNTVCRGCHGDKSNDVQCSGSDGREWKEHLTEGRVSHSVWEYVSQQEAGSTCGW